MEEDLTYTSDLSWFRSYLDNRQLEGDNFIPTQFEALNGLIGGIHRGTLTLAAARPGKGKTTLGANLVEHFCRTRKTLVFSTETSKEKYLEKLISIRSGLAHRTITFGLDQCYERVEEAARTFESRFLALNDRYSPQIETIERQIKTYEPQVVLLDYFQNIGLSNDNRWRREEYNNILSRLTRLAKDQNIAIILNSQIKRFTDGRNDWARPQMSDLKETGKLEEDASVIILLWREDPDTDFLNVSIEKARDLTTGEFKLRVDPETSRLTDASSGVPF